MTEPSIPPSHPSRPDAESPEDTERHRRGVVSRQPGTSSLPEADVTGEPGEEVLGGADGVPLTNDHPPKDAAAKKP